MTPRCVRIDLDEQLCFIYDIPPDFHFKLATAFNSYPDVFRDGVVLETTSVRNWNRSQLLFIDLF